MGRNVRPMHYLAESGLPNQRNGKFGRKWVKAGPDRTMKKRISIEMISSLAETPGIMAIITRNLPFERQELFASLPYDCGENLDRFLKA